MQTTYHSMTARQKAELRGYVALGTSVGRGALLVVFALCLTGAMRYLVEHTKPGAHYLWWVVPSLLVMGFVFVRSKRWTGGREFRQWVRADRAQGTVAAHRIDAVDIIEVEEREDEGPSYFVRTADGQIILLTGQFLEPFKSRGFPWRSFEIIEAPKSKLFFDLKELDAPLPPSFIRQPFTQGERQQFRCRKYRVVEADFESLKIREAQSTGAANAASPRR